LLLGGLIWFLWHIPLVLILPQQVQYTAVEIVLNLIILGLGSVCTFIYLAYVYIKSESVFVAAIAHVTLNNSARSFSYYVEIKNQLLANFGLAITMVIVVLLLYFTKQTIVFKEYFSKDK